MYVWSVLIACRLITVWSTPTPTIKDNPAGNKLIYTPLHSDKVFNLALTNYLVDLAESPPPGAFLRRAAAATMPLHPPWTVLAVQ